MSNTGLSVSRKNSVGEGTRISRATFIKCFAIVALLSFLLRIVYSGHLCEDDGLWFTSAEQMLRGKALFREIYFDKPPALPLLYAACFSLLGSHIIVIRLLTIIYSIAISGVLYLFGSKLYGNREGLLAAVLFAFFSTNPVNNHFQSLNTDFLMMLPYTAAAYFFVRASHEGSVRWALFGGVLTGLATQANPKGLFAVLFFAILLLLVVAGARMSFPADLSKNRFRQRLRLEIAARLFGMAVAGVVAGALPFIVYVAWTRSLAEYWVDVWQWGAAYSGYYPISRLVTRGVPLTAQYLALNNTLLIGLIFVAASVYRRLRSDRERADGAIPLEFRSDATLLIWFAVSFAGLAFGWRFYSNYFFQILPSLCLLGARGLLGLASALKTRSASVRRIAIALIAIGFLVTLVRFHTRTVTLALDWVRGSKSGLNARWYHEVLNREERMVAAVVRDIPGGADAVDQVGIESMRAVSAGPRSGSSGSDYLFIWGSRAEIYYWSGLIPASRFLSSQPLTGVPADAHHDARSHPVLAASATAAARAQLARELERAQPKYIIDELGFYSTELSIQNYPELREVMKHYEKLGATGTFLIYRRKDLEGDAKPEASAVQ